MGERGRRDGREARDLAQHLDVAPGHLGGAAWQRFYRRRVDLPGVTGSIASSTLRALLSRVDSQRRA
jgi:hypothetical protein